MSAVREMARRVVPESLRARWQLRALVRKEWRHGEPEIRLLPGLCDPARLALDVGANRGVYAWYLRRYARAVHAFEPHPRLARRIEGCLAPSVTVWNLAASDRAGRVTLSIPVVDGVEIDACSSIGRSPQEAPGNVEEVDVDARPLDELDLPGVGFVKIDVEGHELAVLRGARGLLERDRPALLVEMEERHRPGILREGGEWLAGLGYRGYFLVDGELAELSRFDPETMQDPANASPYGRLPGRTYVNNFVFLPEPGAAARAGELRPASTP